MGNDGVAAVERALSMLDCFAPGAEHLSLADLAAKTGLHKTTVFRLLNSLVRCSYVVRDLDGRYSLGPRVLYLARIYERGFDLEALVMPVLDQLSRETGESAAYYVASGELGHRLCLFRHQPHEGLHSQVLAGTVMPPDLSSTGRVFASWAQGKHQSGESLPLHSRGARDPYTSSWSIPILGDDDRFVGALTIAGPTARLDHVDKAHFEHLMLRHARELSRRLGASTTIRTALYN